MRTFLLLVAVAATGWPQQVNPGSLLIQDFENRVADYA